MRILYICGDHGIPVFGRKGASTHIREMIAAFRHLGHDVMLAAADISGDVRTEEDFPALGLPWPKSRKLGIDGRYVIGNLLARRALSKAAADFRPDVIYERLALYFRSGEWLAGKLGIPRILEVNSLLAEEQGGRLHFPQMAARIERDLVLKAQAVAAISSVMRDHLVEMGRPPESVRAYPMAVDPARFTYQDPSAIREQLGWDEDVKILGYIGSMNTYHRPSWFMDLAEKMLRREPDNLRFLVVGGSRTKIDRYRGRLFHWVSEGYVHFAGSLPQAELAPWISLMDAVLVPGAAPQSTPTKIFEAAAVGRPLILPATRPVEELTESTAGTSLFQPGNFKDFEDRVRQFLTDPAPFEEEARRLQERILAEYTWQRHAESLTEWFEELAKGRQ